MTGEVLYSLFVLRSDSCFSKVPITFGAGASKYQITKKKMKKKKEWVLANNSVYEWLTVVSPTSRFAYVLFAYVLSRFAQCQVISLTCFHSITRFLLALRRSYVDKTT